MRKHILDRLLFLSRKLPAGLLRQRLEVSFRGLPSGHSVGCRATRINSIAKQMSRCEDYLEVGVQYGFTLASVEVKNKTGVDPNLMFNPKLAPGVKLHRTTSDEFFSELPEEIQYDLIFLDGLHTFEQTARDFLNALKHLRPGGVIVIDDVVPTSEAKALPDREESLKRQLLETGQTDGEWFGDVWKLPVAIEKIFEGALEVRTVGIGVCGQAIFWQSDPIEKMGIPAFSVFRPYATLLFSDYFPEEGIVNLPGYGPETTNFLA